MSIAAALYCAGGLNLGNEFINRGGLHALEALDYESILRFEVMDSALSSWNYPSPALLPGQIRYINKVCDVVFMFAGSILTRPCAPLLELVHEFDIPVVLLGASCCNYGDDDQELADWASSEFDMVVTRDDLTASYMHNTRKVVEGIDLAFWYSDRISMRQNYAVINLDQNFGDDYMIQRRDELLKEKKYEDGVFVVENTHRTPRNIHGYLQISYDWGLWNLYAQAAYVETCRIHSSIACLVNGTPFTYRGSDEGGTIGRNMLTKKIGITLEKGRTYNEDEQEASETYREILLARGETLDKIDDALWSIENET